MSELFNPHGYSDSGYFNGKPGYKVSGTSKDASESMVNCAATLRDMVIATLRKHGPCTPDELADLLGHCVLAIRPRCTELRNTGHIVRTGRRRANTSGRMAMELKLATK